MLDLVPEPRVRPKAESACARGGGGPALVGGYSQRRAPRGTAAYSSTLQQVVEVVSDLVHAAPVQLRLALVVQRVLVVPQVNTARTGGVSPRTRRYTDDTPTEEKPVKLQPAVRVDRAER
jgi:hypothetical protein